MAGEREKARLADDVVAIVVLGTVGLGVDRFALEALEEKDESCACPHEKSFLPEIFVLFQKALRFLMRQQMPSEYAPFKV